MKTNYLVGKIYRSGSKCFRVVGNTPKGFKYIEFSSDLSKGVEDLHKFQKEWDRSAFGGNLKNAEPKAYLEFIACTIDHKHDIIVKIYDNDMNIIGYYQQSKINHHYKFEESISENSLYEATKTIIFGDDENFKNKLDTFNQSNEYRQSTISKYKVNFEKRIALYAQDTLKDIQRLLGAKCFYTANQYLEDIKKNLQDEYPEAVIDMPKNLKGILERVAYMVFDQMKVYMTEKNNMMLPSSKSRIAMVRYAKDNIYGFKTPEDLHVFEDMCREESILGEYEEVDNIFAISRMTFEIQNNPTILEKIENASKSKLDKLVFFKSDKGYTYVINFSVVASKDVDKSDLEVISHMRKQLKRPKKVYTTIRE